MLPDPRVRGGPPTFLGMGEVLGALGVGAEERVRPGWANGSGEEDSLPQQFPMVARWLGILGCGVEVEG